MSGVPPGFVQRVVDDVLRDVRRDMIGQIDTQLNAMLWPPWEKKELPKGTYTITLEYRKEWEENWA